jgi:hypothetical protein
MLLERCPEPAPQLVPTLMTAKVPNQVVMEAKALKVVPIVMILHFSAGNQYNISKTAKSTKVCTATR